MTKPRRLRALSAEERRLWAQVARLVKPLAGRALPDEPAPEAAAGPPVISGPPVPPAARRGVPPAAKPAPPPLLPLERRVKTALRRGKRGVDAAIDLHGLRQDAAHGALIGFLHRAQGAGHELVLVVTGKGGASATDGSLFEERGVLRRVVPHWLRLPDLRGLVAGFEEAAPHHGGSGALYVRLRRRRAG